MGKHHLNLAGRESADWADQPAMERSSSNFAKLEIDIGKIAAFGQSNGGCRVGVKHSRIIKRGVSLLDLRHQRAAVRRARQGPARRRCQQQVSCRGKAEHPVLSAIVGAGSGDRKQLPVAAGVAESQYLDAYICERLAVLIKHMPSDG